MSKQTKTTRLLKSMKSRPEIKTPIATDMFIPNLSGDHSKGNVKSTPVDDLDIVNKKYVDDKTWDISDNTNLAAGTNITLSGDTLNVDNTANIITKVFYIENPSASDAYPICFCSSASTISKVWAETNTGTVDFNIEHRSHGTAESAGTDTMAADLQADDDGATQTSFSDPTIPADKWLFYVSSAVATSPTKLWIVVKFTED